jgi:serine/threonine protein kinase
MPLEEIKRIEESTPFLKEGFLVEGAQGDEIVINSLDEIEFVREGNYKLGKGSYGEVELAVHRKTGKRLAVKKIDKSSLANKKIKATLMREVEIHLRLKHENIVRLFTSLEDDKYIYLVLEYATKGNLFYLIRNKKTLTEDEAFYFFIQACAGIYFLHKNGFIHRDIKPENLLIDD